MKTHLFIATSLLACMTLSTLGEDSSKNNNESDEKIKALEAEINALRAQLRAEGQIRRGDQDRDHRGHDDHHEHDEDGRHTSQFEYVYEIDGDLRDAPLGMIRSQLGGMPSGSEAMIVINGKEVSVERFMEMSAHGEDHEGEHRGHSHRVMHFDLGDMTNGEIGGEVHIEIEGDMNRMPGFVPQMIMQQLGGQMGGPMGGPMGGQMGGPMGGPMAYAVGPHDSPFVVFGPTGHMNGHMGFAAPMMHEEQMEAIHKAVMETMEAHGLPMRIFDEVHEEMAEYGHMDPFEAMEMIIHRLEDDGIDPRPIVELREMIYQQLGGHDAHEDPFFREGGEFVGKLNMASEIGMALSSRMDVAIFGIWEARQHLEPEHRIEILEPVLLNSDIDLAVRNAAAMVLKESFLEIDQPRRAREILSWQIRHNGSRVPLN